MGNFTRRVAILCVCACAVSCPGDEDDDTGPHPQVTPPKPSRWHVTLDNRLVADSAIYPCTCPEPPWGPGETCTGAPYGSTWPYRNIRRLQAELLITGREVEAVWVRSHTEISLPACGMTMCDDGWCVDFAYTGVAVSVQPPTELQRGTAHSDDIYLEFGEPDGWSEANRVQPGYFIDGHFSPVPEVHLGWGDVLFTTTFPLESGVTSFLGPNGGFTAVLTCLENCPNRECTQSCDDANPCTDDHCVVGEGCSHIKLNSGTCDQDDCHQAGQCTDGHCIADTPVDCDDTNPCTDDFCDPATGCLNLANSVELTDTDPTDCMTDRCLNGSPDQIPNGYETPPQNSPDDCLREVCLEGIGKDSAPDMDEPNCDCVSDSDCDDLNECTTDSCTSLECHNTPDDSIEPRQMDPFDCVKQVCSNGNITIEPADEIPPDIHAGDCITRVCTDGQLVVEPADDEMPLDTPFNCNDEVCEGGQVVLKPWDEDPPLNLDWTDCMEPICDNGTIVLVPWPEEDPSCP